MGNHRNLSKRRWSLGWLSTLDPRRRIIWIADAHRGDGKHFVVCADEKLSALIELKSAASSRRKIGVEGQRFIAHHCLFVRRRSHLRDRLRWEMSPLLQPG
jgi:hypothetical protein